MKIAFCLAGNMREFRSAYTQWGFDKYDCDIFLHTWDFVGTKQTKSTASAKYHSYDYLELIPYTLHELKTVYKITDAEVERYYPDFYNRFFRETDIVEYNKISEYGFDPGRDDRHAQSQVTYASFLSMWYKRWKCFEMMLFHSLRKKITYDYVVMTRPDYSMTFDFDRIPLDVLLVPELAPDREFDVHDVYACGPLPAVREYCMLYPRFHRMALDWKLGNTPIYHSNMLYKYLQEINLPYYKVPQQNNTLGISHFFHRPQ